MPPSIEPEYVFRKGDRELTAETDRHSTFGEIVRLRTVDGQITRIHHDLVEEQSGYVKERLVARAAGTLAPGAIHDKVTRYIWEFYARWLYGEAITRDMWPDIWFVDGYFLDLVVLHKLGETLQDALFQDEIMDIIMRLIRKESRQPKGEEDIERLHLDCVLSRVLWPVTSTPEVRYLMAHYVVFCGSAACYGEIEECLKAAKDPEFSAAVTQALLSKIMGKCTATRWEHACEYHKHGDGEACTLGGGDSGGESEENGEVGAVESD